MMDVKETVRICTCESSPPGFVANDGIHCGYCGGHFRYGEDCKEHHYISSKDIAQYILHGDES